ncbi:RNA polymerase sigma factor [Chitinophaga nivalis]|uniref:Sigma-70 family RNA polymerase sigma factor n=1 Tax=Chitinophaga nivalis TaxID=2991709 RepID=A0ABT3INX8_9BACT|nr:sigma-70 family RNA polymerase sigma factor [Chitinophaga nivalis]MCW3464642.1 sigma-70 family RNA polymerase sigma factor [Chitinophaga nivalis]MCW3485667.1 sigma-70 family RNA polymerase sigma factor [Chitinophaga nivalis]
MLKAKCSAEYGAREEKDYAVFWHEMQQDNEQGLYKIYHEVYDNLYHYGVSVVLDKAMVKEAINDVFVEIWRKRQQLEMPDNINGYLFICFKRRLYKILSKHNKTASQEDSLLFIEPEERPYEEILIRQETDQQVKQKLERMLDLLTWRQKEFIRLRFYDNLSIEEIAAKTAATPRTIYNTIHNALVRIREVYTDASFIALLLLLVDMEKNS